MRLARIQRRRVAVALAGAGLTALLGPALPAAAGTSGAGHSGAAAVHLRRAVQVAMPPGAGPASRSYLLAVSCPVAGWCAGGGTFIDSAGHYQPTAAVYAAGKWTRARELRLPANADASPFAEVNGVSCTSKGNCVATGSYDSATRSQGFIATESGGTWSRARQVALPSNAAAKPLSQLNGVKCTSAGNCVAVGLYAVSATHDEAFVVTESGGKWRRGQQVRMPADAGRDPEGYLYSVSCAAAGSCTAVGDYDTKTGAQVLVAVTESGGRWHAAVKVGLPAGAAASPGADFNGVWCTGAGTCTAVGNYAAKTAVRHPLVATESRGRWTRARRISLVPAGASAQPRPFLSSVSCPRSGACVATGGYTDAAGGHAVMTVTQSAGKWVRAAEVLLPPNASPGVDLNADLRSVSCTAGGFCAAVGDYLTQSGGYQALAATTG